jgi:phosphoribosylamine--glycine ligase
MEIAILGHMGRDEAIADRLQGQQLHVLGQWANPGLVEKAEASGGEFHTIKSIKDNEDIADYIQAIEPDMFLTHFDDALASGVVDAIKRRVTDKRMLPVLIPSPDQASARVEWDKFYLRKLIDMLDPEFNPQNYMVTSIAEANAAIDAFQSLGKEIALKPRNLTGGKGVKVQGKHFETYNEANTYAAGVLGASNQQGLEVQEKLEGYEFTLQLLTDGQTLILPPATYDYPYREDGDVGPGTGGMGAFSMKATEQLPFLDQTDYNAAIALMKQLLVVMRDRGDDYKGVLYPTFFKTCNGLKIVEVNARGGDPELINILDLLEDSVDFASVLRATALGELDSASVQFQPLASAMVYLVHPEYGHSRAEPITFSMDADVIAAIGCEVRFAAAESIAAKTYQTASTSRIVGLSALDDTPWAARAKIDEAIQGGFGAELALAYRQDVANEMYIKQMGGF